MLGAALTIAPAFSGCTEHNELSDKPNDAEVSSLDASKKPDTEVSDAARDALLADMGSQLDAAITTLPDTGKEDGSITADSASTSDATSTDAFTPDASQGRLCPNGEPPVAEEFYSTDDDNCDGVDHVPNVYAVVCDTDRPAQISVVPDSVGVSVACPDNTRRADHDEFIVLRTDDGVPTQVVTTADENGTAVITIVRPIDAPEMGPTTATGIDGGNDRIIGESCVIPVPGDQYAAECFRTQTDGGRQTIFQIADPE